MELLILIPVFFIVVFGAAILSSLWELFWKVGFIVIGVAIVVEIVKSLF